MKLLHINTVDRGGAAKVALRLMEAQRADAHEVSMFLARCWNPAPNRYIIPETCDDSLRDACQKAGLLDYQFQGSHRMVEEQTFQEAALVHLHNLHGGYFNPFSLPLLSAGKPMVWTLHDMAAITGHCAHSFECDRWRNGCGQCPDLTIYPAIEVDTSDQLWRHKQAIYEKVQLQLVAPSRWLAEKVAESNLGHLPITHIPNGVDTNVFRPYPKQEVRALFNLPQDKILVGAAAQAGALGNPWKGAAYSKEVLDHLLPRRNDVCFVNIGGGNETPREGIAHIPYIEDETRLAQAYSALDIFLYSPVADNCPLVVLEAMACGLPMVTFATGGVPELVRHEKEGFLARYKDARDLLEQLERLLDDRARCKRFSEACRQRALSHYDHDIIHRAYLDLYGKTQAAFHSAPPPEQDLLSYVPDRVKTMEYQRAVSFVSHLRQIR